MEAVVIGSLSPAPPFCGLALPLVDILQALLETEHRRIFAVKSVAKAAGVVCS